MVTRFRLGRIIQGSRYINRTYLSAEGLRNGDFSLSIIRTEYTDSGRYRCVLTKDGEEVALGEVDLEVKVPISQSALFVESGQKVVLSCFGHVDWSGSEAAFIQWKRWTQVVLQWKSGTLFVDPVFEGRVFSPAILFFLISIIPSVWILELHHQENKASNPQCRKLDSWDNVKSILPTNGTMVNETLKHLERMLTSVCPNDWILGLHQVLLILLILGKWLLPLGGGVTRDELSQLLLIFVGTAADILEFTSETLSDVKWGEQQATGVCNLGSVDVEYVAVSFSPGRFVITSLCFFNIPPSDVTDVALKSSKMTYKIVQDPSSDWRRALLFCEISV
ncbi:transmembrane 26-like protein [Labeo rohita]|uniref:Transmembrane 26-like protein n=1 Tax=Labeo rohita TaxID=84645 RepID=A0A498P2K4_LABRO|nr:transmembrane 26-like protein [Labeo rohita]